MITQAELELLEQYIDGVLDENDVERLRDVLRDNSGARAKLRSLATVEFGMQDLAASRDAGSLDVVSELAVASDIEPRRRQVVQPTRSWATTLRYGFVVAGTFVATILAMIGVQGTWPTPSSSPDSRVEVARVATVSSLDNCRWGNGQAFREGDRLPVGSLVIESGAAEIWFDGGARLILQGKTECRVESAGSAMLLTGKVVFHGASDDTFDLRTPDSILVDLGTEYAVSVTGEGEEIHVFEGEVWRTAREDQQEVDFISAGDARRYRRGDARGSEQVALSESFVRGISHKSDSSAPRGDQLIASESFAYDDAAILTSGKAQGGLGWAGPWQGESRSLSKEPAADASLNPSESLQFGKLSGTGGCMTVSGNIAVHRTLREPLRLDLDAVYYFRVIFHEDAGANEPSGTVFINFRQSEAVDRNPARLVSGLKPSRMLFARLQGTSRARSTGPVNGTGMFVGKIVARMHQPDQVFLTVLKPTDPLDAEPERWTLSGDPTDCPEAFDLLAIHGISRNLRIDELRLGRTWRSIIKDDDLSDIR
ncbi:MAG: FecR family protein [Planctomycetales bacterium]